MKATFSIFPKFYRHLNVAELAALVREVGADTTNAVIRDDYWVEPDHLAKQLPAFVKAMDREGLKVRFATAGYPPKALIADPTPLKIMADTGITEFRIDYFRMADDVRQALAEARNLLTYLAPICEEHGVRAVYQLHHQTLVPSASAAWQIVNGLPAKWVGIELDPGNQAFEGYESWARSARLLREYVVAMGVKDVAMSRDSSHADDPDKGWRKQWAPIYEGITNWHDVVKALSSIGFDGTFVFMPFYDENDSDAMTKKLRREIAYLRGVLRSAGSDAK